MTTAILVAISLMWIPVALLFLGYGEPKGTGVITGLVGLVTVFGAFLQTAMFADAFTGGLLFAHGLLYMVVAYALLTGLEDMRSVGNISLAVAIISAIYAVVFLIGTELVPQSLYLGLAATGYTVLTLEVWLNAYGKFPAKGLAFSLLVWVVIGLWIPAFSLMTNGTLPL